MREREKERQREKDVQREVKSWLTSIKPNDNLFAGHEVKNDPNIVARKISFIQQMATGCHRKKGLAAKSLKMNQQKRSQGRKLS